MTPSLKRTYTLISFSLPLYGIYLDADYVLSSEEIVFKMKWKVSNESMQSRSMMKLKLIQLSFCLV